MSAGTYREARESAYLIDCEREGQHRRERSKVKAHSDPFPRRRDASWYRSRAPRWRPAHSRSATNHKTQRATHDVRRRKIVLGLEISHLSSRLDTILEQGDEHRPITINVGTNHHGHLDVAPDEVRPVALEDLNRLEPVLRFPKVHSLVVRAPISATPTKSRCDKPWPSGT